MDGKQKLFLIILGMAMVLVAVKFGLEKLAPVEDLDNATEIAQTTEENTQPEEKSVAKEYVNVFFIGQNENHEEVYKAAKREYDPNVDGSKIKFAIDSLMNGPKPTEKEKGVYTEIPTSAKVIYIQELPDKIIVNVSAEFANGGGTDSLYKRIYQLIKTVKHNTTIPVYLYIDGKQADVIGGEGIMLSQPLNDRSLDG